MVAKVLIEGKGERAAGRVLVAKPGDAVAIAACTVIAGALVGAPFHQQQMLGICDGQAAKQKTVHDAEDGGVGADGDAEGKDGDQGRAGLAAQQARGEANILRGSAEKCTDRHNSVTFLSGVGPLDDRRAGGGTVSWGWAAGLFPFRKFSGSSNSPTFAGDSPFREGVALWKPAPAPTYARQP